MQSARLDPKCLALAGGAITAAVVNAFAHREQDAGSGCSLHHSVTPLSRNARALSQRKIRAAGGWLIVKEQVNQKRKAQDLTLNAWH